MRNHTCLCSAPSSVSHTDDDIDSFLDGSGASSILRHESEPRSQTEISRECPGERIVQRCTQGSTNLPENGMWQSLAISVCKDLPKDQRSRSSRQCKPRRAALLPASRAGRTLQEKADREERVNINKGFEGRTSIALSMGRSRREPLPRRATRTCRRVCMRAARAC